MSFNLLPSRLKHYERFIPSLYREQAKLRAQARHRRGTSLGRVGVNLSKRTSPNNKEIRPLISEFGVNPKRGQIKKILRAIDLARDSCDKSVRICYE